MLFASNSNDFTTPPILDESMIQKAQAGDAASLNQVIIEIQSYVFHVAGIYTTNVSDQEDVTQVTLAKIAMKISDFHGKCKFSTWTFQITRNTGLDFIRKQDARNNVDAKCQELPISAEFDSGHAESDDDWDGSPQNPGGQIADTYNATPEDALLNDERDELVRQAMNAINPRHKQVLYYREWIGEDYKTLAKRFNVTVSRIKSLISDSKKSLKRALEEIIDFDPALLQ